MSAQAGDAFKRPHNEAILLYPGEIPQNLNLNYDAVSMLLSRQTSSISNTPYKWAFIDKPKDGELFLAFFRTQPAIVDGIVWVEASERRYQIPKPVTAGAQQPDIECFEAHHGFIPGVDNIAHRVRRRFHFMRSPGHPSLFVIHYSRSASPVQIPPNLQGTQARAYPLPSLPSVQVYVLGPRAGEAIWKEEGGAVAVSKPPETRSLNQVTQELMAQNAAMRELEKKRDAALRNRRDDDDSGDDEHLSARMLAVSRYRRNHELLEEVFMHAAFGTTRVPVVRSDEVMDLEEINKQLAAAEAEVVILQEKAAARGRAREEQENVSVDAAMLS